MFGENLQNLHNCFVPLHCQCCTSNAVRNFQVHLSYDIKSIYDDLYIQDFVQLVQFRIHFTLLLNNVPVFTAT